MTLRLFALLVLTAGPAFAAPPAGCDGETARETLQRVGEHGELGTSTGRILRLSDVRLAEGAREVLAAFEGDEVVVHLDGGRDRWGRVPGRVILAADGTDLATLLVQEGLALVDVGGADGLCRPDLLAQEAPARAARRGIWSAVPLSADDPQAVAARAGRFAVIEGRVVGVGERARWTYLNFGRDFSRDFAVSISRRNWEAMRRAGLSAEALTGRRVRVRGIVEIRRAPGIEITSADMIEWRDEPRVPPAAR